MTKRIFKTVKTWIFSLRVRFFLLLIVALAIGMTIYFSTHFLAFNYINTVYVAEENKKARELEYIKELQTYITENNISSEQIGKLSQWAKEHQYVYLIIYKDDEFFYTSDDEPEVVEPEDGGDSAPEADSDEAPEQTPDDDTLTDEESEQTPDDDTLTDEGSEQTPGEDTSPEDTLPEGGENTEGGETDTDSGEGEEGNASDSDTSGDGADSDGEDDDKEDKENDKEKPDKEPGGVTVDYPTREELFEYAKKNEQHPLILEDGTMLASLTEFTEYLYFDIANILTLCLGVIFVIIFITLYFQRVTGRILHLGRDVNKIAEGDMDHEIKVRGRDEISKLSANVDNMRNSIISNLKKEREAINSNTELITSMSHDIRTPLTVLLGYIDVMQDKARDDEEMRSYLAAAESTAMRLKKLSDDMFGYFLVFGDGEMEIHAESYDAITLIDQMLSEHVLLMKESGYNVRLAGFDYSGFSGELIKTDAQKLVRIFDNIFSNIYKYADKTEPVSIYLTKKGDTAEISFENFISNDTDKAESNGIGLKTCRKLAEYIGADFDFSSDEGKFTVVVRLECHK